MRRGRAGGGRRFLRELEVLQHQRGGEARLVVVVGGRGRHQARHRAVARQRPALARGGGRHVEQRLVRQPELLGQHERLADADHADAEHHVVADLGGLAGAGFAAVHDLPAHGLQDRLGLREGILAAAAHEGQRRRLRAADAAETGASSESILASAASLCAPRAEATSMVEQSMNSVPGLAACSMPEP